MNKNKKALLIGLSLGNGCLSKPDKFGSVSIDISHCEKQKELLIYKAKLLTSLIGGKQNKIHELNRERNNIFHKSFRYRKSCRYFRILRKMLYIDNVKTYSIKLLNKLNDQSIAIWIMDDGSLTLRKRKDKITSCQFKLSTCTTYEQNEIIQSFFKKRYDINLSILKHMNNLYSLGCGTKEYLKLAIVIDKYVIPSMKYKTEILKFQECQTSCER